MSTPLPEGLDLNTITEPGTYRFYAEEHQPFDPPTHMIEAVGPVPVRAWTITDRETGETRIVHRADGGTVTPDPQ